MDKAIAAKGSISIGISKTTPDGKSVDAAGGGSTSIPVHTDTVTISVTGREGSATVGTDGKPIDSSAPFVLMHELVGHAIPRIAGSDTGNAVDNENKVRAEVTTHRLREAEPTAIEYFHLPGRRGWRSRAGAWPTPRRSSGRRSPRTRGPSRCPGGR